MPVRQALLGSRQNAWKTKRNPERKFMAGRKIVATEFQHAPGPSVFEYGFIRTVTEENEFVEYPAPILLRLIPGHDGMSGNRAVKDPVFAYALGYRLLPHQMTLLKAQACNVAPPSVQIDWAGQAIRIPGLAHEIQSSVF